MEQSLRHRDKWDRAELNRRHTDFQSVALPTELQSQPKGWQIYTL